MSSSLLCFLLGLAVGFSAFEQQTYLPSLWSQIPIWLGLGAAMLTAWLALRYSTQWVPAWVLGVICAQFLMGPLAAQRLTLRVPLNCHNVALTAPFELLEATLEPNGRKRLTLLHLGEHECLPKNARLQTSLESETSNLRMGATYSLEGRLKPTRGSLQLDGFDLEHYWLTRGISGWLKLNNKSLTLIIESSPSISNWLQQVRLNTSEWIVRALEDHPQTGVVLALVTGDQGLISPTQRQTFSETGIAHLIAISGLHVTLLAQLVSALFVVAWRSSTRCCRWAPAQRLAPWVALSVACIYAILAGWGVPAQRTVFMQAVAASLQSTGARVSPWTVWGCAMGMTVFVHPWAWSDLGFLFSFGAVGLLLLCHHTAHRFQKPRWPALSEAIRSQWALTVGLIPLTVALFNQHSLVAPVVNALSIPWMSFLSTPLALFGTLLGQEWMLKLCASTLETQDFWIQAMAQQSWATLVLPTPANWALTLACAGAVMFVLPRELFPRWSALLLMGSLFLPAPRPEKGELWVDVHDVGQGSAITLRTKEHTLVYDTGPAFSERSNAARRVVWPFLKSHGIDKLDQLWLSHFDNDHAGGTAFLLERLHIDQFVAHQPVDPNWLVLPSSSPLPAANCHAMPAWTWDHVRFDPLHLPVDKDTRENNRSCVLKVTAGSQALLLAGDIESEAELELIKRHGQNLRATVLLVPHHGSKTSSGRPFLAAVQPKVAVIQTGWRNRYGHPHPQIKARYQARHIALLNTAQDGALHLRLTPDANAVFVRKARHTANNYWRAHETSAFLTH